MTWLLKAGVVMFLKQMGLTVSIAAAPWGRRGALIQCKLHNLMRDTRLLNLNIDIQTRLTHS